MINKRKNAMSNKFKIEVCGNINMAGADASALERLEGREYATEEEAAKVVDALAASWANPHGIWEIVAVVEA